jgi:hypothetical protein
MHGHEYSYWQCTINLRPFRPAQWLEINSSDLGGIKPANLYEYEG